MSLTYSQDLWGGIKVVYDHYEEGRNTLAFLLAFLKERITAEEKHASKLEKQASKAVGWTEAGTLGESWKAIKTWQEASAKHLATVASQLQTTVVTPLTTLKKDAEKQKEALHKDVDKLEASMVKMKDLLAKAKAKYVKSCADYEKSTLELRAADPVGTKPKDMEKLRHRVTADKTHADQAHDAYKQQIAAHRDFQQQFEEQYRGILQQFGDMETKRREQVKEVFGMFLDTQDHYSRAMTESVIPLREAIQALDSAADIQLQLQKHQTGAHPDALVEYEPYVTENQVDVPADPVENGARANPTLERSRSKSIKVPETKKDKGKDKSKDKKSKIDDAPPPLVAPPEDESTTTAEGAAASSAPAEVDGAGAEPVVEAAPKSDGKKHRKNSVSERSNSTVTPRGDGETSPKSGDKVKVKSPRKKDKHLDAEKPAAEPAPVAAGTDGDAAQTSTTPPKANKDGRPPVARALFEYEATDETEISFQEGDLIILSLYDGEVPDCPGWMKGRCKGKEGIFPANHAELFAEAKLCKATFDFDVSEPEELALKEGETLIIEATHEDWYEGRNEKGETGIFPSTYVTLL
jgi:hypothetical protein